MVASRTFEHTEHTRLLCERLREEHLKQVVEAAPDAEAGDPRHSILGASMGKGAKSRKLYFTPAGTGES